MSTLEISISQDVEKRLSEMAKRVGRTKASYAKELLLEQLEDVEDYYQAEEILANDDPKKQVGILDMMKKYDLAH